MMIRHLKQMITAFKRLIKKQRVGRFSQSTAFTLLTKPLWQHEKIRTLVGAPLVAAAITGASLAAPQVDTLSAWDISQSPTVIPGYSANSEHTFLLPVTQLTGISQYFHAGHPGIDFRAPLRSDVVAMDNGVVTEIVDSTVGYGRHVYIQHEDNRVGLYAHLGLIMVNIGDEVRAGDKIGEIGMTGWTTGPHLHFEVRAESGAINPIPLLSKALSELK